MEPQDLIGKYFRYRWDLFRVTEVDEERDSVELIMVPSLAIQTSASLSNLLNGKSSFEPYQWNMPI